MLDHLSIQCADVEASAAFYDAVLAPLGGRRLMELGPVIGYGVPPQPDFWIGPQQTGDATVGVLGTGLLPGRQHPRVVNVS